MSRPALKAGAPGTHPSAMTFSVRQRRLLVQRVSELGPTEHQEIYRLLQRSRISHSSNRNGVFVDLSIVPDAVLAELQSFIDFCHANKAGLDEYDQWLSACKRTHTFGAMPGGGASGSGSGAGTGAGAGAGASAPEAPEAAEAPAAAAAPPSGPAQTAPSPNTPMPASTPAARRMVNSKFQLACKKYARRRVGVEGGSTAPECMAPLSVEPY